MLMGRYRLAGNPNHPWTQHKVARTYIEGTGVPRDLNCAANYVSLFEKSQGKYAKKDASLLRRR